MMAKTLDLNEFIFFFPFTGKRFLILNRNIYIGLMSFTLNKIKWLWCDVKSLGGLETQWVSSLIKKSKIYSVFKKGWSLKSLLKSLDGGLDKNAN